MSILDVVAAAQAANGNTIEAHIETALLEGRKLSVGFQEKLTAANVSRSIEQAKTLTMTLSDDDRSLLNAPILQTAARLQLGEQRFELVHVGKLGSTVTLTFEDWWVAEMRRHTKPRKALRGRVTRAGFVHLLCREISGLAFYSPGIPKDHPNPAKAKHDAAKRPSAAVPMRTPLHPSNTVATSVLATEFGGRHDPGTGYVGHVHGKAFDLRGQWAFAELSSNPQDFQPNFAALGDLPALAKVEVTYKGRTVVVAKMDVGRGNATNFPKLDLWWEVAEKLGFPGEDHIDIRRVPDSTPVGPVGPGVDLPSTGGFSDLQPVGTTPVNLNRTAIDTFEFTRGQPGQRENTWDCAGRLAGDVQWRRFMVGNALWFVDDAQLVKSAPVLRVSEQSPGVDAIDGDSDVGQANSTATLTVRVDQWWAHPGVVIVLQNVGVLSGKWLVAQIDQDLFSPVATVSLVRPQPALPEPNPFVVKSASAAGQVIGDASGSGSTGDPLGGFPAGGPALPFVSGDYDYPLAPRSSLIALIGVPYAGTHALDNNWESDIAYDLECAAGTQVVAVQDGVVGSQIGALDSRNQDGSPGHLSWHNRGYGDTRMQGLRLHLVTAGDEFYYQHLSTIAVVAGQHVRKGEFLGTTGAMNHLHFARKNGDPGVVIGHPTPGFVLKRFPN